MINRELFLKYLIAVGYDALKAEILYIFNAFEGEDLRVDDLMKIMTGKATSRTVRTKIASLYKTGFLLISKDSITNSYKVDNARVDKMQDTIQEIAKNIDLYKTVSSLNSGKTFHTYMKDASYEYEDSFTDKMADSQKEDAGQDVRNEVDAEETACQNDTYEDSFIYDKMSESHSFLNSIALVKDNNATPMKANDVTLEVVTSVTPIEDNSATPVKDTSVAPMKDTDLTIVRENTTEEESVKAHEEKSKNQFYTWEHYAQFTTEDWQAARAEGTMPGKERMHTLLLGAYLLGMYKKHGVDMGLIPSDFNSKYGRLATAMLKFFTAQNEGDELKGFNASLDWITEFLRMPKDSFAGEAGWPIQMCFTRDMYRQAGQYKAKGKKRNDTGNVIFTQEEREKAWGQAKIV